LASQKKHFYIGIILNPLNDHECQYFPEGMLVIRDGQVHDVLPLAQGKEKYQREMNSRNTTNLVHRLILPAFFDLHFHWVQDDVREMPKDSLLEWLEKYTFPAEAKFSDPKYASKKAKHFFQKLVSAGTLGGACYSSIHDVALDSAMSEVKGEFVIGNVLMNMNSPAILTQTESDSLKTVRSAIKKYGKRYCLTPRFAITTSPEVMKKGSELADKAGCFKQSHLSETPAEIEFVLSIYRKLPGFEKVKSYTEIYEKVGMLGERSLMGHGIHLSNKELKILRKSETVLVHCPTSNAPIREKGLGSGLFDFRRVEKAKVRWALGSDIGGGPFLSMFDVIQSFVKQHHRQGISEATFVKGLYRATLAGAEAMGISHRAGNLLPGKDANFIIVPMPLKARKHKSGEQLLKSLIGRRKREDFAGLVQQTVFRGKSIFKRK
jgi:guanine deaminase